MSFGLPLAARLAHSSAKDAVRLHRVRPVNWTVDLDDAGQIIRVVPHPKAVKGETPYQVLAPKEAKNRAGSIFPLLITDTASYVLGLEKVGGKKQNGRDKQLAYQTLLKQAVHLPLVCAVLRGANALTPERFGELAATAGAAEVSADDIITFRVAGQHPHDDPEVQAFWIDHVASAGGDKAEQVDSATGERGPLASNSPLITGIPGGMATLTWQSTNAPSMRRYGLTTLGLTQPTIERVAARLTELARDPLTSHQPKGSAFKVLHWLEGEGVDPWLSLTQPTPENVRDMLTAASRSAGEEALVNLAVVRGNSARLQVLDHAQVPLSVAARHAQRYLELTRDLPLWQAETALTYPGDKSAERLVAGLYLHVLTGQRLPSGLLPLLLNAWKRELKVTRAQRALTALLLEIPMQDPSTIPPHLANAYQLGRYAQVAHHVHRRANPSSALTVTDRFLRLMATQPTAAFAQMERQLASVLLGLRRSRPQLETVLGKELAAVTAPLTLPLPLRFSLEEQAAFMLGFEHERGARIEAAQIRKAEREMNAARAPQGDQA
ncbi:hypothetical protein Dxin01_00850 [Deinococcus xinjiangensis]|uniref:Type I-C CRISPR-associated protein Cas8c/Csd1 n=1 Tax=Deinococcus xinjiangensis TaxID=457454 RepID=A0ABP9V771_9DEIO